MVFSLPTRVLKPVALSLQDAVAPVGNVLVLSDSDGEHEHTLVEGGEPDEINFLQTAIVTRQDHSLGLRDFTESIFRSCETNMPTQYKDLVFFTVSSGNMSRHTITGERPQKFDFFAQRYQVCSACEDRVHLIPLGAPICVNLQQLSFDDLMGNLVVRRLVEGSVIPHLPKTMNLGSTFQHCCLSRFVFLLAKSHHYILSSI